jgi:hypothetical protein
VALELKEWAELIFGVSVEPSVERVIALDEFCGSDAASLQRLAEVFEGAGTLLAPYSDAAVAQAFWDLSSNVFPAVFEESIDWAVRHRFLRSFEPLFRNLFEVRCTPDLGHFSQGCPLNTACYMWFDFNCWTSTPDPLTRNRLDTEFLASMRSILGIDHVACQESALHGLGHWHRNHPAEVESIIDDFLERRPRLSEELREYAGYARQGRVL